MTKKQIIKNIVQFVAIFTGVLVVAAIDSLEMWTLLVILGCVVAYAVYDFYKWNEEQEARVRSLTPISEEMAKEYSSFIRETIARMEREGK